jgi:hypothetical protein
LADALRAEISEGTESPRSKEDNATSLPGG